MSRGCGVILPHTALCQQLFVLRDHKDDHIIKHIGYMELNNRAFKPSALDAAE